MYILGAGLAGLLAANVYRKHNPIVIEAQQSLPNNHSAVLRHRDVKISEATSIPFKKVKVIKAVNDHGTITTTPTPKICNEYSLKVTGKLLSRSITNLEPVTRYIAPPDFIQKLALGVNIQYGRAVDFETIDGWATAGAPIISTIPMPVMWDILPEGMLGHPPKFHYRNITVFSTYLSSHSVDVYQTIYYNNPKLGLYRISITGNKVMAEFAFDDYTDLGFTPHVTEDGELIEDVYTYLAHFLARDFGIPLSMTQSWIKSDNKYGKIADIDNTIRKRVIHDMTQQYGIFSLGRYATWRNLLLDDVYDDLIAIQKLMEQRAI